MTPDLHHKHCEPCEGGTNPLTHDEEVLYGKETPDWEIHREGEHKITRKFECKNFKDALQFIQKIGNIAESEGHHPDILLHSYKYVTITLFTHAIGGLSVNDFIVASKIDRIEK